MTSLARKDSVANGTVQQTGASRPLPQGAVSGLVLAVATVVAGALGYVVTIVLTRALGPAEFGALGALLGLGVIGSVAATALQLEVARVVAAHRGGPVRRLLATSAYAALATSGVFLLLTPVVARVLRLDGWEDAALLALTIFPLTFASGVLGILLGRRQLGRFAVVLVGVAVARVAAAVLTSLVGGDTTMVLATTAALSAVPGLWGLHLVTRPHAAEVEVRDVATNRELVVGLLRAVAGAAALMILLNVDLLVARARLGDAASGQYAFLTVFGRITFWGTSFMSLWVFPRVADSAGSVRAVRMATCVVLVGGLAAVSTVFLFGHRAVLLLAGPAYESAVPYASAFAVAGACISVIQLATYVDVARARHHLTVIVWLAAGALAVSCWLLRASSIGSIIGVTLVVLSLVSLFALVQLFRQPKTASEDLREA